MLKIGCHLSVSAGFAAMGKTAVSIGANVFQFFSRNPRGGAAKAIDGEDVNAFLAIAAENGLSCLLAHAPYTLNACSEKAHLREFARDTMTGDLRRMEYLPGNMYNFHPGSRGAQELDTAVDQIAGF